ncbi:MAG: hypothetical protein AB1451_15555 [Nitrospirota bacterium]
MRPWGDVRSAAVGLLALVLASCGGGSETEQAVPLLPAIGISPTSVIMPVGGRQTFTAVVDGATDPTVTWTATGGTVNSFGQYTAPSSPGEYQITASLLSDPTISATATVTVEPTEVKEVFITPSQATLGVNAVQVFTARVVGGSTSAVDWSVTPGDGSGGSITADGVYTAPSTIPRGPITVSATTRATPIMTAAATVTVTDALPFSVQIVDTSGQQNQTSELINGEKRIFQAVVSGTSQVDVSWSLTPGGTVTPAANPLFAVVTAPDPPGPYVLSATVTDRITNVDMTAERPIDVLFVSVTVAPPTETVVAGGTLSFSATVTTNDGTGDLTFVSPVANRSNPDHPIVWSVRESAGGSVDADLGVYTAPLIGGLYHVVATHGKYAAKSAAATVNVQSASVTLSSSTVSVESGATTTLTATVSNVAGVTCGNKDCRDVTWSIQEGSAGGSFTQTGFNDTLGQANATYQAPTRVGSRVFHVIATSVADPSKRAVANITILGVWKAAAAGGDHTVAIKTDGTLWAWGRNADGQLGDGTRINRSSPVQSGTDTDWAAVVAGARHTLALKNGSVDTLNEGRLYAWGANDVGQLGVATPDAFSNVPVEIPGGPWRMVSARGDHTVAIKEDGTLWAWGDNFYGQVGSGQSGDGAQQATPTRLIVTDQSGADISFETVAAGTFHTLAIATDGSLWAWGRNEAGQLGDGTPDQRDVPTRIGIDTDWIAIDAGAAHSVGVRRNAGSSAAEGTLWGWGDNGSGQLGDAAIAAPVREPTQIGTDTNWAKVFAGESHTFALKTEPTAVGVDQTLWGWGHNMHGELALGQSGAAQISAPTELGTAISRTWLMADSGFHHSVMLTADGHLWTTGANLFGQIGDGTSASKATPVRAGGASTGWQGAKLAAGEVHNAAIKIVGQTADQPPISYGTLWTWGNNERGQLGDGTLADRDLPIQIGADATWRQVAVGSLHTVAIKTDGTLWAWGDNSMGQLGVGSQTEWSATPTEVPKPSASDPWVGVATGAFHTLAITRNGNLWAWGANGNGQLGIPSPAPAPPYPPEFLPVLVNNPADPVAWINVAAGGDHTLAIKREFPAPGIAIFTLWAWGDNEFRQVGDGSFTDRSEPTKITLDASTATLTPDWQSVLAGGQHSLGLKGAGELWGWGDNSFGQVGAVAPVGQDTVGAPMLVDSTTTWRSLAGGTAHSAGVKSNGTLWTWGSNEFGQLGYETIDPVTGLPICCQPLPTQLGTETLWSTVSAGYGHTIATKTDGALWAWGLNDAGQLGDDAAWRTTLIEIHADSP